MSTGSKFPFSRPEAILASLVALGLCFGLAVLPRDISASRAEMANYIQSHDCVVAQTDGRQTLSYRCDLPVKGEYITTEKLIEQAIALAQSKKTKTP